MLESNVILILWTLCKKKEKGREKKKDTCYHENRRKRVTASEWWSYTWWSYWRRHLFQAKKKKAVLHFSLSPFVCWVQISTTLCSFFINDDKRITYTPTQSVHVLRFYNSMNKKEKWAWKKEQKKKQNLSIVVCCDDRFLLCD